MRSEELISWFWQEFQERPPEVGGTGGMCQCAVRKFMGQSHTPTKMQSFLMIGLFLDQMVFTHYHNQIVAKHYPNFYANFQNAFWFPKLYQHGAARMGSPGFFVSSYHGFDKKMDWRSTHEVTQRLVHDFLTWLAAETNSEASIDQFMAVAKREVNREFEGHTAPNFCKLINSSLPKITSKAQTDLFSMPPTETFDTLWNYCSSKNRAIPHTWKVLYEMLDGKRQNSSGRWEPPVPFILAAWYETTPLEKYLRFKDHIQWAADHNQLDEIEAHLRNLPEKDWYHFEEL